MLKSVLILFFNFHVFLSYINIDKNEEKNLPIFNPPFLNQMTGCPTKNVEVLFDLVIFFFISNIRKITTIKII